MFNALRDAAPDRWGRKVLGLQASRAAETLSEFEILTAMHSKQRIGALAFGPSPKDPPASMAGWACNTEFFTRTENDLLEVAHIIKLIEETPESELDGLREKLPEDAFWKALTSIYSVGGARPKAMAEINGKAFIVKFPKKDDLWNEPLVEHATMTLAAKAGIHVAETQVRDFSGITALLVRRFDRNQQNEPRHFVSGFTIRDVMEDGEWGSYQDLALAARRLGDENVGKELFKRMLFNAFCANTDDHLRNHAFFVHRTQVELTPAFDIVPRKIRASNYELALGCGKLGHVTSKENLLSKTEPFGLTPQGATRLYEEIQDVVAGWEEHFVSVGVSNREVKELRMRFKFHH